MKSEGITCQKTVKFSLDDQEEASEPPDLVKMAKNLASHVAGSSSSSLNSSKASTTSYGSDHNLSVVSNCSCPNYNSKKRRCGRFEVTDLQDDDEMMNTACASFKLTEEAHPTQDTGCSVEAEEHYWFTQADLKRHQANHSLSGSFHSAGGEPHHGQNHHYQHSQQHVAQNNSHNQNGKNVSYQRTHTGGVGTGNQLDNSVNFAFNTTPSDISSTENQSFSSDIDPGYCTPYFEQERRQVPNHGGFYSPYNNHYEVYPQGNGNVGYYQQGVAQNRRHSNSSRVNPHHGSQSRNVSGDESPNKDLSEMYRMHHDIVLALSDKLNTLPDVSNMIVNILDRVMPAQNTVSRTNVNHENVQF